MSIAITVYKDVAADRLAVTCYQDGLVQVDIGDDVILEFQMDDPTPNTESIRKALKMAFSKLALYDVLPLTIEGRDFPLL